MGWAERANPNSLYNRKRYICTPEAPMREITVSEEKIFLIGKIGRFFKQKKERE